MITYTNFGSLAIGDFFILDSKPYQKVDDPTGSGFIFNAYNKQESIYIFVQDDTIVGVEREIKK